MAEPTYVSNVRIKRVRGTLRLAYLPGEANPVVFSVHGAIAAHYGVDAAKLGESHAATLDYIVAATAGWLVGTLGRALEVREIDASDGRLTAEVRGEVETSDDGVLIIRRIHVCHRIVAAEEKRGTIERVHAVYAQKCPVYRSLQAAIEITSSYELIVR